MSAGIRLTVSLRHRSDAEVLHFDSGPLRAIADVYTALSEIEAALADHETAIASRQAELIVRVASRDFRADLWSPPRREQRVPQREEF
jgi:hypothetical protein